VNKDEIIRDLLVKLLTQSHAHMDLNEAVADFPMKRINEIFPNGEYSAWGLLEHIRRTQNDILEFIVNPKYLEKEWPKDYWPIPGHKATVSEWNETINNWQKDMEKLVKLVKNPNTDLYIKIPGGNGQNIFREILLVADHNAYHIGEFAIIRQVMGTWSKKRP
jgi:hypothetical protein